MLSSCHKEEATLAADQQVRMTEYSENLSVITSENGQKSYHFTAPLMEGYTLAREPYREFRKGVRIVTYNKGDSLSTVDATLTANYAIYYEKRELWEAKGNVVIVKEDGKRLYTQQLFWNATTKRIYSNVDTRIVDGVDNFIGEGFESDDELRKWKFRRMKGRMTVEVTPTGERTQEIPLAPTPLEEEERAGRLAPLSDRSSDPSADSALSSASEASGVTGHGFGCCDRGGRYDEFDGCGGFVRRGRRKRPFRQGARPRLFDGYIRFRRACCGRLTLRFPARCERTCFRRERRRAGGRVRCDR